MKQLGVIDSIQRMWKDKEVNLYQQQWFRVVPMPEHLKFSLREDEFKLATVEITDANGKNATKAVIWVVKGRVFSITFSAPPATLGNDFKVVQVKLLQDPMSTESGVSIEDDMQLPPDYLDLIASSRLVVNGWHFNEPKKLRSFVSERDSYLVLAEKEDVGLLACGVYVHQDKVFFFDLGDGDGIEVVGSLLQFCQGTH